MRIDSRVFAAALLGLCLAAPVGATPPDHAPAHGWRKKHDPRYVGYTGKKWEKDYGILAGRCHREALGAVLGAAVGAAIGTQIGKGEGNKVAIIVGTALGTVLGARAGREADREDAACIGHALELAKDGQRVSWTDAEGTPYRIRPLKATSIDGLPCRVFELTVAGRTTRETACQNEPGVWTLR